VIDRENQANQYPESKDLDIVINVFTRGVKRMVSESSNASSAASGDCVPNKLMQGSSTEGFTAHNILLDDGTQTYPAAGYLMSQNGILLAAQRILRLVYPDGLAGKSIVDIGCLEGGFTTEFARLGMNATGIEVRESNYRNCLRVKAGTSLPNLTFIRDDAANIKHHGPFDVCFVCGLLYHLDEPRKFLTNAADVCGRVMILETHVARAHESPARHLYGLSTLSENEGLPGRWFPEYGEVTTEGLDQLKWASYSNSRSFWIQKEYLLHLLSDLGFDIVLQQFDCDWNIAEQNTTGWRYTHDRELLVGIRSSERARW
jgi:2-polyprenyl-3-methyl-5-hydroxy-6-metoxy-1,4-benzoquinol methylase